jgi:hypothetical protein
MKPYMHEGELLQTEDPVRTAVIRRTLQDKYAKLERQDWLLIGEALMVLRLAHPDNHKAYGKAVEEDGRFEGLDKDSKANALWFALNQNDPMLLSVYTDNNINHPTGIRQAVRALKAQQQAIPAPKPQPKVEDSPPPQRPPCPGAEGHGPGCWRWSEAFEEWIQEPAIDKAAMEARHTEELVPPKRTNTPITPENLVAHEERVKANRAKQQATFDSFSNSLKSLLDQTQQHMPAAILDDASPIEYLTQAFATMLQYGGAPAAKLAKQMFSSAYHPDSGKIKHDASLMGSINKALSFLEK